MGMIDRCLVAAHEAGMRAVLCLTKADLAPATEFLEAYADFDVTTVVTSVEAGCQGLDELKEILAGHFSVLVGHSGVGKSTLINALIPQAERVVGVVNQVTSPTSPRPRTGVCRCVRTLKTQLPAPSMLGRRVRILSLFLPLTRPRIRSAGGVPPGWLRFAGSWTRWLAQ